MGGWGLVVFGGGYGGFVRVIGWGLVVVMGNIENVVMGDGVWIIGFKFVFIFEFGVYFMVFEGCIFSFCWFLSLIVCKGDYVVWNV